MPRSSRHKSHKQSKHSSTREQSESDSDVKMKDNKNSKEEVSIRVSRDSGSAEKRKLSSSKDPSGHGNGDESEEYIASKRRKEKADDRWNSGGDEKDMRGEIPRVDGEKSSKSKALVDSKSKSSRRHDSGSEKKEEVVGLVVEKEESKSGSRVESKRRHGDSGSEKKLEIVGEKEESKSSSRVESKRKSEKDSGRKEVQQNKESKEKDRGVERERKSQEIKREADARTGDGEVGRKQESQLVSEERQGKQELPIQDELRNLELEKELEKRIRKRDSSSDKDKHHRDVKESEERQPSSRGERAKDGRYKDEKHKDTSYGDKHRENGDRDNRHKDDKYREDAERESRYRDVKYREDDKNIRHKDDKYREDGDRHKVVKYHEDVERDNRQKDDKYRDEGDKYNRHRDDKYGEDGDRDNRHRDDKYHEDGDRDYRHRGDKYREDGDRDDRRRDDRYMEDGNRDSKNREEKTWEDIGRDGRHREGKQKDDYDKDRRIRDVKYRDERSSRDHASDKSDIKRLRDESNAAELHHRKSIHRDGSPLFDDRSTRYKDDKGRRRSSDKENLSDIRSRSIKEQYSDTEKKSMTSARVESVSDRGRSNFRNVDVEITPPNYKRRRSSPSSSSHAAKDHHRLTKQEESKYRDYAHEERVRHNVTSSKENAGAAGASEKASLSRSNEKPLQKDESHLGEVSADRRLKEDALTSPLQMVDKSPSSTSNDRRHLNRSDVRRNLDIEDSGQKSGGSKDARDYSGREGRGSRELPMETFQGDDLSQADGDNLSVSSPFSRTGHFSNNSRSHLPPPPFRMGADSSLVLGSFDDNNRGKSNYRHRRIGDPNMGRFQGSPWRGVPNWPSPVTNGFIPFQHGPPHVGFHPVMQQFPAPSMFGVRPSMELNQSGVAYHVPDGDRFSSHGRQLAWRNPVDDSCPRPIHGWDSNNAVFGDESHIYGRLDWDHNRSLASSRGWETSGDMWKGQNRGATTELPSTPPKDNYSAHGPADEFSPGQSGLQVQNDQKQPSIQVESMDIDRSSDAFIKDNTLEAPKTIPEEIHNLSRNEDTCLPHVYLSMLDISPDLTQPELYSQYTNLTEMDQNSNSEEDDFKFLLVEEAIDATLKISNETSNASLFSSIDDTVFQKAMSLYKKVRGEVVAINGHKEPHSSVEKLQSALTLNQEGGVSNDDKPEEVVPASDQQGEVDAAASALIKVKMEVPLAITSEKIDELVLVDGQEKLEESTKVKMELDPVSKQETTLDYIVEVKSSSPENVERYNAHSLCEIEEVKRASDSKGTCSATNNNEGQESHNAKCGPLLFSDVLSTEACEAVVPESIEPGLVNLSRIHQSAESTH